MYNPNPYGSGQSPYNTGSAPFSSPNPSPMGGNPFGPAQPGPGMYAGGGTNSAMAAQARGFKIWSIINLVFSALSVFLGILSFAGWFNVAPLVLSIVATVKICPLADGGAYFSSAAANDLRTVKILNIITDSLYGANILLIILGVVGLLAAKSLL